MSKAFSNDDSSNEPVIVPDRAPLPPGVPNYVTERGRRLLEEERQELLAERARLNALESDDGAEEQRQQLGVVNKRLRDLTERIATARTVTQPARPDQAVRFGATVTLKSVEGGAAGEPRRIKLVGADEAAESADLVAFYAPIARAILGHYPGDRVSRRTETGEEVLEIVDVRYETQ